MLGHGYEPGWIRLIDFENLGQSLTGRSNTCLMSKSQSDNLVIWKVFRQAGFSGKLGLVLSTWFGAGLLPTAPGTFGTIAAIPLVLGLGLLGKWCSAFVLALLIGVAIWASGIARDLLGQNDPPTVVIDEVAGFLLAMILLPSSWQALVLGFFLFRFFDILKPFPIKRAEQLGGALGIVADDLLAGLYAFAVAKIFILIF